MVLNLTHIGVGGRHWNEIWARIFGTCQHFVMAASGIAITHPHRHLMISSDGSLKASSTTKLLLEASLLSIFCRNSYNFMAIGRCWDVPSVQFLELKPQNSQNFASRTQLMSSSRDDVAGMAAGRHLGGRLGVGEMAGHMTCVGFLCVK